MDRAPSAKQRAQQSADDAFDDDNDDSDSSQPETSHALEQLRSLVQSNHTVAKQEATAAAETSNASDVIGSDKVAAGDGDTHIYEVVSQGFDRNEADLLANDKLSSDLQVAMQSFKNVIYDITQSKSNSDVTTATATDGPSTSAGVTSAGVTSSDRTTPSAAVDASADPARAATDSDSNGESDVTDVNTDAKRGPVWTDFHQQLEELSQHTFKVLSYSL